MASPKTISGRIGVSGEIVNPVKAKRLQRQGAKAVRFDASRGAFVTESEARDPGRKTVWEKVQKKLAGYVANVGHGDRTVSVRIDFGPRGSVAVSPIEETIQTATVAHKEPDVDNLEAALTAARERGRLRAAEILGAEDMLTADEFAELLGTSRMTINTKRRSGAVLGLTGTKRGYRFPRWQLDANGNPYPELAELHKRLGGPWAVYRFMVQRHGELNGLTGRQALERGKQRAVLDAAESVGRDFS
ncbi:MAG: helix-turn-helix domain-containing protein [Rhizorhabdus sp.]|uniref:helix-turn-helix domain-containing protein n=1 Tax=Rhizorhabdus sp. TaxID=1968843 RepID=UPI001B6A4318|nr:helix-turn-helix domain-containing protein [Rhizorhabdus sp.]MBP8232125.1 helix-turn-helix domain-containing protein [Rhizorhabdus sp.]